jgi:glucose-1-phosphate thymidylyltransferase
VSGWYDCGKVDTLLETNQHLLTDGRARAPASPGSGSTIIPPVYIEDGVSLRDARIGPNVSIETGSVIVESTIANAILGRNVRVTRSTVREALVGDDQVIESRVIERSVLDAGELAPAT